MIFICVFIWWLIGLSSVAMTYRVAGQDYEFQDDFGEIAVFSILGPLLFLIFINEIATNSDLRSYKLWRSPKDANVNLLNKIQELEEKLRTDSKHQEGESWQQSKDSENLHKKVDGVNRKLNAVIKQVASEIKIPKPKKAKAKKKSST